MSDKRGIFSLEEFYDLQLSGETTDIFDVFKFPPIGGPFGYFTGGETPQSSAVDRVDFDNDTAAASPKGVLYVNRFAHGAVGNKFFGYVAGGNGGGQYSTVNRIDYANDSAIATPKGDLSNNHTNTAGAGNENYGYIGGSNPSTSSYINRIDFANDVATSAKKGNLSSGARGLLGATGNQSYGYWAGGSPGSGFRSWMDRLDYANDSANTSPKGPLSAANGYISATGNASYGYFTGGEINLTLVDRVDYSNDTATASPKGPLNVGRLEHGATGNSSFGYLGAGVVNPSAQRSTVDRIDYSNDTATAATKGPLTRVARSIAAISPREFGTPAVTPQTSIGNRFIDNAAPLASVNGDFGYWGGGLNNGTVIYRIDFSNDSATGLLRSAFPADRYGQGATSSTSHGYFGGGYDSSMISSIQRLDFAADTDSTSPKGQLNRNIQELSGVGNNSYGYFVGGDDGNPTTSYVDRVDFSNDTATATAKGQLSHATGNAGAAGNQSYGWVGSGFGIGSYVTRIDYSNDTPTASPRGPLSSATGYLSATGNANYGWFAGGPHPYSALGHTAVDRIDYSNDTATASPRGNLSVDRWRASATGNTSFGYWGGGYNTSNPSGSGYNSSTKIDRVDFSNDTVTASLGGALFLGKGTNASINYLAALSPRANALPSEVVQFPYQGGTGGGGGGSWEILMHSNASKGSSGEGGNTTKWGNTSTNTWQGITASSTGANARTAFGDGSGLYNGFFTTTGITKIALVDGTGNMTDMTSHTNYLVYDLVNTGTGSETMYEILYRLDQYNLTNPNWAGGPGDSLFGTDSCTDFVAGSATSGRLTATSDTWLARNPAAPAPLSPSPSTTTQPHVFCIWGVNRDSDNDTQVLCAYSGDLSQGCGKSDSWRGNSPYQTFWSYWGNDWHSNSQGQTISRGKQTDPGIASGAPYNSQYNVYLMGFSSGGGGGDAGGPNIPSPTKLTPPGPAMGYVLGGSGPTGGSTVDRIDYSNDTPTASARSLMTIATRYHSAAGNKSHGYAFGGSTPATSPGFGTSKVERVDYANDTATLALKGSLLRTVYRSYAGVGNETHGYYSGGQGQNPGSPASAQSTYVDRITYANDTATGVQKGNLAAGRYLHSASGNKTYGYVQGGSPSYQNNTLVQRMNYSNDTATHSPKGPLSHGCRKLTATGNLNYGYVAGGTNQATSRIERIDYGNDTAVASPKGPMTVVRSSLSSTSAPEYGYITGGSLDNSGLARTSQIDRMEYANDTATALAKGPLSAARGYNGGVSSRDAGTI